MRLSWLLALIVLASCAARDDVVSQAGDARTPIRAALRGPRLPEPGQTIELELTLDRRIPAAAELSIRLELPANTRLVRGAQHERVWGAGPALRRFALAIEGLPRDDLRIVLDARGANFGYHAELPYRFGRTAPLPRTPPLAERTLRVGTRSLGRSVSVQH
jgi:hypothetical protein